MISLDYPRSMYIIRSNIIKNTYMMIRKAKQEWSYRHNIISICALVALTALSACSREVGMTDQDAIDNFCNEPSAKADTHIERCDDLFKVYSANAKKLDAMDSYYTDKGIFIDLCGGMLPPTDECKSLTAKKCEVISESCTGK